MGKLPQRFGTAVNCPELPEARGHTKATLVIWATHLRRVTSEWASIVDCAGHAQEPRIDWGDISIRAASLRKTTPCMAKLHHEATQKQKSCPGVVTYTQRAESETCSRPCIDAPGFRASPYKADYAEVRVPSALPRRRRCAAREDKCMSAGAQEHDGRGQNGKRRPKRAG